MKEKFALIDHKLRESGGHQIRMAEIFLCTSGDFVAYGCDECALFNERLVNHFSTDHRKAHQFPSLPEEHVIPWRRLLHYLRCLFVVMKSNAVYFRDLREIQTSGEYIWFAPNTQQFTFPALIIYASLHRTRRIAAYFQNAPGRYQIGCGALIRLLKLRNLVCIAEEQVMKERMTALMRVPVQSLLYPLLPKAFTDGELPAGPEFQRPISIAVLGLPRREKGFHLISHVVEALEERISAGEIKFVIQTGDPNEDHEALDAAIAWLRMRTGVELIEKTLDPREYLDELLKCGAVLTPYLKESYSRRLSWITIEGAALAKPVLVTDGTLAADFLDSFCAGIIFRDQDVPGIVAAIARLSENYDSYLDQAIQAGYALREANSAEKFFFTVCSFFD